MNFTAVEFAPTAIGIDTAAFDDSGYLAASVQSQIPDFASLGITSELPFVTIIIGGGGGGGLTALLDDTTPQLGGDLDLNGHGITGLLSATPGTPTTAKFLRADGTWQTPPGIGGGTTTPIEWDGVADSDRSGAPTDRFVRLVTDLTSSDVAYRLCDTSNPAVVDGQIVTIKDDTYTADANSGILVSVDLSSADTMPGGYADSAVVIRSGGGSLSFQADKTAHTWSLITPLVIPGDLSTGNVGVPTTGAVADAINSAITALPTLTGTEGVTVVDNGDGTLSVKRVYGRKPWDGHAGDYTILPTDEYIVQTGDITTRTPNATATLPATDAVPDGKEYVIHDGSGTASSAHKLVLAANVGVGDTIEGGIYYGAAIWIEQGGGTIRIRNNQADRLWEVVSSQAAGGALLGNDLTLPAGIMTGGTLTRGRITGSAVAVVDTYTQTADPADKYVGKGLYYNVKRTFNYAGTYGPSASDGAVGPTDTGFGPGGVIQISGVSTYNYGFAGAGRDTLNFTPIIFASQHQVRNGVGHAIQMATSWGFMEGTQYIADTDTVKLMGTDMGIYPGPTRGDHYSAGFVDNRCFWTANGGTLDGADGLLDGVWHVGYDSIPSFLGNVTMFGRAGVWIHDAGGPSAIGITGIDGVDANLLYQRGISIDRLRGASVLNTGILCNSPVQLWVDDVTSTNGFYNATTNPSGEPDSRKLELTKSPGDVLTIGVGSTKYLNWTSPAAPTITMLRIGGTWNYRQRPYALGAFSALYADPTITHAAALNSSTPPGTSVIPINTMMTLKPTYAAVTSTAAVNFGVLRGYVTDVLVTKSGANPLTVDSVIGADFGITVDSGVTLTARTALNIQDVQGSGTIVQNVGVNIGVLSGSIPIGIYNLSSTVAGGGLYGSIAANGTLTISSTSSSSKGGDVNINNPTLHLSYSSHTFTTGPYYPFRHDGTIINNDTAGALGTTNNTAMIRIGTTHNVAQTAPALAPVLTGFDFQPIHQNNTTGSITIGLVAGVVSQPTIRANAPGVGNTVTANWYGFYAKPVFSVVTNGALTVSAATGFIMPQTNIPSGVTVGAGVGVQVNGPTVASGGTVTNQWKGIEILTGTFTAGGTWATQYGLDIGALSGATTSNVAIITRGSSNPVLFAGKVTAGGTTAGTWNLHVQGGNAATTAIGIDVSTTAPTAPGSSAGIAMSLYKGATNTYWLWTYNDGGTTVYFYTKVNSITNGTITWTKATSLPT